MKYYVSLEQNFIDMYSFLKDKKKDLFPTHFFEEHNAKPFFMGPMLYFPIIVGEYGHQMPYAGTIGLLRAKVTNNLDLDENQIEILMDEDAIKQAGVRMSPQSIKMLKTLRSNCKVFETDGSWSSRGFRCRAEEVIKCLAFGYLSYASDRGFCDQMAYSDYSLQNFVQDKRNSLDLVSRKILEHFQTTEKSHWNIRSLGTRFAQTIIRTAKAPDENYVVKWRKPSKSSKWPYTLDHHWFTCQESPVATAHHTLLALMTDRHAHKNRDQLMLNLPVFSNIRQLEICRKLLENFFGNLREAVKPHSSAFANFLSGVNDFEWPNGRYSSRKIAPEMFPVKACLATGVIPLFGDSGNFEKFVPINGHLHDNTEVLYFDCDADSLVKKRVDVTFMLLYSSGLINRENLESILGPVSVSGAALKTDPTRVQLHISKNVVCCLPVDSASQSVYKMMAKYGIHQSSTSSQQTSEPIEELDPEDIDCEEEDASIAF